MDAPKRSVSIMFDERYMPKSKQPHTRVNSLNDFMARDKSTPDLKPDPDKYIKKIPIVIPNSPKFRDIFERSYAQKQKKLTVRINNYINEAKSHIPSIKSTVSKLIDETSSIIDKRHSYKGRGLKENRETFFLIHYLHQLRIKYESLCLSSMENRIIFASALESRLLTFHFDPQSLVVVDFEGYFASIPGREDKIQSLHKKIKILESQIKLPEYIPPPDDLESQLIYPTSDTLKLFTDVAERAKTMSLGKLIRHFKEMTDDPEELIILLDHSFDFGWVNCQYPFICLRPSKYPQYLDATPAAFDVKYVPDEYYHTRIGDLASSNWPYKGVVSIIEALHFETSPIKMAKQMYLALTETAASVQKVTKTPIDIDFDTLFPLILISVLASGITEDPCLLPYIASLASVRLPDTFCELGASYAEAILNHIVFLDEDEIMRNV